MFDRKVAISLSPHSALQRQGSVCKCLTLHLIPTAVRHSSQVTHTALLTEQTYLASDRVPKVLF